MKGPSAMKGSAALILVIIMLALITTVGIEIAARSQVSAKLVTYRRDDAKAYELAKAAYRWALLRLQLDTTLDQIPAIPGTNFGGKKDDLTELQWNMALPYPFPVQSLTNKETPEQIAEKLGGSFTSQIFDESSKINLNDVGSGGLETRKTWSGASAVLEDLLLSPRFSVYTKGKDHRELLWALEDWIDSDSEVNHMAGGLEDTEYRTPNPYFKVKNGPLYTVSEIRLLKPVTEELYQELLPFVTVYPFNAKLPKVSTQPVQPQGKINVNTAPVELLAAIFNRQVLPNARARLECAQLVVKYRQNVAFRSIKGQEPSFQSFLKAQCAGEDKGLETQKTISQYVEPILDVRSDLFRIEATGIVGDVQKTIHAVLSRKNPGSPKLYYWKVL